jgi:hypothetical protein|tara:strand:+ start:376 stop:528 length:153 start_codon:yes stop_codon:yes gene_type:complete
MDQALTAIAFQYIISGQWNKKARNLSYGSRISYTKGMIIFSYKDKGQILT